jgi:hypothetical protein
VEAKGESLARSGNRLDGAKIAVHSTPDSWAFFEGPGGGRPGGNQGGGGFGGQGGPGGPGGQDGPGGRW